ncbi:MAG: hypothetical protein WD314_00745 [Trueperaceae bacterium]
MKQLKLVLLSVAISSLIAVASAQNDLNPPLPDGYVSVSEIVRLPEFIPGVGALYIHPDDAPVGPWLSYGNDGNLVEVVFMVPLSELQNSTDWENLASGTFETLGASGIEHVDVSFNGGHPGMAEAHYHIRLVLIGDEQQQAALAE